MAEEIVQDEVVDEVEELEDTDTDTESEPEEGDADYWKNRALKAEGTIVKNKKESKAEEPRETEEPKSVSSSEPERLDRIELRQDGYADEVIDKIMELGGKSALKNPIVKRSADELQREHEANQASDISDGPNSSPKIKYTQEDLDKMSVEELEEVLPHADKD